MNSGTAPPGASPPPSDGEVDAWVGLSLLPGVGPRTIARWVDRAGSAAAVWRHLPGFVGRRADRAEILAARQTLDPGSVVAEARARGLAVLAACDPAYPALLRAIADPPPVLYTKGSLEDAAAVAVVGSRRATPYGLAAAERIAYDLAQAGVTVVSGLARGIDGAAHQAALDAGGRTVAVLGCGADVVYPPEHGRLAAAVAAQGALVSEFPPGTPPLPGHFPRRNRLISGLALGVVVVEGATDSGALVTVDCALDQGREVFAVPGSIFSPRSRAPHALLRQGARPIESAADVLSDLGLHPAGRGTTARSERPAGPGSGDRESRVLALIEAGPRPFDEIVEQTALSAAEVAALVTMLELRGLIRTLPGQMVMRCAAGSGRDGERS